MPHNPSDQPSPAHFPTTRWSLVLQAGNPNTPLARECLAELCGAYWYPLYAYIRRRGLDAKPKPWCQQRSTESRRKCARRKRRTGTS
jgi:hypothetical protein